MRTVFWNLNGSTRCTELVNSDEDLFWPSPTYSASSVPKMKASPAPNFIGMLLDSAEMTEPLETRLSHGSRIWVGTLNPLVEVVRTAIYGSLISLGTRTDCELYHAVHQPLICLQCSLHW